MQNQTLVAVPLFIFMGLVLVALYIGYLLCVAWLQRHRRPARTISAGAC
jgi:TRAP-type mannitol/chloroaromatic compound transport system permease large subunit